MASPAVADVQPKPVTPLEKAFVDAAEDILFGSVSIYLAPEISLLTTIRLLAPLGNTLSTPSTLSKSAYNHNLTIFPCDTPVRWTALSNPYAQMGSSAYIAV
jgi:hypothetical protein